jgi:hypothetical protein
LQIEDSITAYDEQNEEWIDNEAVMVYSKTIMCGPVREKSLRRSGSNRQLWGHLDAALEIKGKILEWLKMSI